MNTQALRWIVVAGALLVSSPGMAQPLNDLQARLATLRTEPLTRMEVEVELRHKGTAPLHLNDSKQRGTAVIVNGRFGAEVRKQKWTKDSRRFSFWGKQEKEPDLPLMTEDEAQDLLDPVGTIDLILANAELVSDEAATWEGRPARLLVLRADFPVAAQRGKDAPPEGAHSPFLEEAKIWLDESGLPIALKRSVNAKLGPVTATEQRTLTFRHADGRLLVDTVEADYSGNALAVLRSRDHKTMKVTKVK